MSLSNLRRLVSLSKAKKNRVQRSHRRASSPRLEALEKRQLLAAELDNFLTDQHADLNVQYDSGEWSLGPLADLEGEEDPFQFTNDEALIYVGAGAEGTRGGGSAFDFIGVDAGEPFHLLPLNQDQNLVWLGFAGYGLDPAIMDEYDAFEESKGRRSATEARWAKATLTDVRHMNPDGSDGTGDFSMWSTGSFGGALVWMSSYQDDVDNANSTGLDVTDGISADDALWLTPGGHQHFSFGFSQPGRYEVDLTLSAYFDDDGFSTPNLNGFDASDPITVYFSVESVGTLAFEADSYSVDEDAGMASIDVVRTGGRDGRIAVDYATADGTAGASDYTTTNGTLVFADGEIRKTITVPILEDSDAESDETFTLELSDGSPASIDNYLRTIEGASGGLLGTVTTATVTIAASDQSMNIPFGLPEVVGDGMAGASSLEAVDMDGDGDMDILAVGYDANTVNWYENAGDGSFTERFVADEFLVWFAHPADMDADGDLDVVTTAYTGRLAWYANVGGGNFSTTPNVIEENSYDRTTTADIDGDGVLDVVNSGYSGSRVSDQVVWYRGLGGGAFDSGEQLISGIENLGSMVVDDFNGDGRPDVAVTEHVVNRTAWFLNNGDLTFTAKQTQDSGDLPFVEQVVDLDGDGHPDLLVTDYFDERYSWLPNDGSGNFEPRQELPVEIAAVYSTQAGDLDGDGDMDIAFVSYGPDMAYVENLGGGNFAPARVISKEAGNSTQVVIADLDADGDGDIALTSYSRGEVLMYENALGNFTNQTVAPADGLYAAGSAIDVQIHFGVAVEVTGMPEVTLQVGSQDVVAEYLSGSGGPTLTFRYMVEEADVDADGVELTSTAVDLAGGTILDVDGEPVALAISPASFPGAIVNGSAPSVRSIQRVDI
ncbi:MAG: FG-GAP-like repeat-containing protein, partial [Planctomycetota bacterium]